MTIRYEELRALSGGPKPKARSLLVDQGAFTLIGGGDIGGKARGLVEMSELLKARFGPAEFPDFSVGIPRFSVIGTEMFDLFITQNRLHDLALSSTRDGHISNAFQQAELPEPLMVALKQLIADEHRPLAVRSSSRLEDALREPFAGVYGTKMVPNNQFSASARVRALVEAVKFVYASTFSQAAKSYRKATGHRDEEEKMAVILQEVVGERHGDRFYPAISGVGRSQNFYRHGHARPQDGVVSLALGLGKTIVEGGQVWTYCPAHPKARPPFASTKEFLNGTQTRFWSVNMGKPPTYDPHQETEYLCEGNLQDAEQAGVLSQLASTYDPQSDRVIVGTRCRGPRILSFAPILEFGSVPLNDLLVPLLQAGEEAFGDPVEIEFAVNLSRATGGCFQFGFLQVRPMLISRVQVEVAERELTGKDVLVASEHVLGNGRLNTIEDVVYVKPDAFSAKDTCLIAAELDAMNRQLVEQERPYLLVAIGRLGSSDPWLGIPVSWGQVCGAKAVVEASTAEMNVDMSQGSHFFHNVTNLRVLYFSTGRPGQGRLRWDWFEKQRSVRDARFVRHVALDRPLSIKVDGASGRGVIVHERADQIGD